MNTTLTEVSLRERAAVALRTREEAIEVQNARRDLEERTSRINALSGAIKRQLGIDVEPHQICYSEGQAEAAIEGIGFYMTRDFYDYDHYRAGELVAMLPCEDPKCLNRVISHGLYGIDDLGAFLEGRTFPHEHYYGEDTETTRPTPPAIRTATFNEHDPELRIIDAIRDMIQVYGVQPCP